MGASSEHSLFEQPQDRSAILDKDPQAQRRPQHREIDSAKTKTRQENIDAIPHMLVVQCCNCLGQRFRAVGATPAVVQFGMLRIVCGQAGFEGCEDKEQSIADALISGGR